MRAFTSAFHGRSLETFLAEYPTMCEGTFPELSIARPDVQHWLSQHMNEFISLPNLDEAMQAQMWFVLRGSRLQYTDILALDMDQFLYLHQERLRVISFGVRCTCPDKQIKQMDAVDQSNGLFNNIWAMYCDAGLRMVIQQLMSEVNPEEIDLMLRQYGALEAFRGIFAHVAWKLGRR